MDTAVLRERFPALRNSRGIYFDNAATSLVPDDVLGEVARYSREFSVNAGRGAYSLATKLTVEIDEARERIADFIGVEPCEIVFTANTTDAINKLALSLKYKPRKSIAVTHLEHHSNLLPWRLVSERNDIPLQLIRYTPQGIIDVNHAEKTLRRNCQLIAFTAASNVLGTVQPVKELTNLAHEKGVLVVVDAAQWAGHFAMNLKDWDCDFCAFSAHKMCGPTGTGILYVRKEVQKQLSPIFLGGGTVGDVTDEVMKLKDFPYCFEPGTLNIEGIFGFAAAVKFLSEVGMDDIEKRVSGLHRHLLGGLSEIEGVITYTPKDVDNAGITSFCIKGLTPHRTASIFDRKGKLMLRSGYHCAVPLVKSLGNGKGTVRASLAFYNTAEEVERFLEITDEIVKEL